MAASAEQSGWRYRVLRFYAMAMLMAVAMASFFQHEVNLGTPTEGQALHITQARTLVAAHYQSTVPAALAQAPSVSLPNRIDHHLNFGGGFVWYQFELYAHPDHAYEALYIPRLAMNGEVYLNGELLENFGTMMGEYAERNWNRPKLIRHLGSRLKPGPNTVSIQVRAFPNYIAGLSSLWVGSQENLHEAFLARQRLQIQFVFISTAFMLGAGIVLLLVQAIQRRFTAKILLLAAACLLWTVRNLAFLTTNPPLGHTEWVQFAQAGLLLFGGVVFRLVLDFCEVPPKRWERRLRAAYMLSFPVLLLSRSDWALQLVGVYGLLALLAYLWSVRLLWQHGNARRQLVAHALAFGLLCFTLLGFLDFFMLIGERSFEGHFLTQYMGVVMFLVLCYFLIDHYNNLMTQADQFNDTLKERLLDQEKTLAKQFALVQQMNEERVQLAERQRLMADMHDGLGAYLVAALHQMRSPQFDRESTQALLGQALQDLQFNIDSLEPLEQDLTTLLGTFRYRMSSTLNAADIALTWRIEDPIPPLPYLDPKNALQLLRMLQEIFTNILKHAQASAIDLHVYLDEHGITVQVSDNGVGFDRATSQPGRGLGNLEQRAKQLRASLSIDTAPGQGTRVSIGLPLTLEDTTA